jgi:hypothetical protein
VDAELKKMLENAHPSQMKFEDAGKGIRLEALNDAENLSEATCATDLVRRIGRFK